MVISNVCQDLKRAFIAPVLLSYLTRESRKLLNFQSKRRYNLNHLPFLISFHQFFWPHKSIFLVRWRISLTIIDFYPIPFCHRFSLGFFIQRISFFFFVALREKNILQNKTISRVWRAIKQRIFCYVHARTLVSKGRKQNNIWDNPNEIFSKYSSMRCLKSNF